VHALPGGHACICAVIVLAACASHHVPSSVTHGGATSATSASSRPVVTGASSSVAPWRTRAAAYLDGRVRDDLEHPLRIPMLQQQLDCAANCHTTLPYLLARPLLPGGQPHQDEVRKGVADRVAGVTDWSSATPWFTKSEKIARWSRGSEAVADAAALVDDDVARGRALTPESLRALDMMWAQQRPDGAWDWFGFGMEPWETSDDCGAALAATLVATLPAASRARAQGHVDRLAAYIRGRLTDATHPVGVHQKTHFLWASAGWPELLDDRRRHALSDEIVGKQRPDGGWSLATWGGDLADPDGASDGYATSIATLALCESKLAPASASRGIEWLTRSQREDGAWPGRSVNEHDPLLDKFESDMATSFAVIALSRCGRD
jgi:Prenyltransferase and squalene oxidase repeat